MRIPSIRLSCRSEETHADPFALHERTHEPKTTARPRQEARHAPVRRRPRRTPQELRPVPQAFPAGADLLRREGQQRRGNREDVLRARRQLRRGEHAGVSHRSPEHRQAAGQAAAGFHLGQDHLRQPDQAGGDARGARPLQAAGDLRQPRRGQEDREARAARRPRPAAAGAQHRFDGGAIEQVWRAPRRGGGSDRLRPRARAHRRGALVPRRQPVHESRKLYSVDPPLRQHLRRGEITRFHPQAARYRWRFPRGLRRERAQVQRPGQEDQPRAQPAVPEGDRDSRRAGAVPRGLGGLRRLQDHRQGGAERQTLLLRQRRRLPHLLGRDL